MAKLKESETNRILVSNKTRQGYDLIILKLAGSFVLGLKNNKEQV